MILVVDNYDSFTFNLVQALEMAGADLLVVRNDRIARDEIERLADAPDAGRPLRALLISPGPGNPESAGISVDAIRLAAEHRIPMLGVCLGLQCFGAAFGARIVRAPTLVHGAASEVEHGGQGLLAGLPSPFLAGRYHSLCVDAATLPAEIEVTARTHDGVVMAMRHRRLPLEGVQFHPESVLTPDGPRLLANFLRLAGEGDATVLEDAASWSFPHGGLDRRSRWSPDGGTATQIGALGAAGPAVVGSAARAARHGTEVTAR